MIDWHLFARSVKEGSALDPESCAIDANLAINRPLRNIFRYVGNQTCDVVMPAGSHYRTQARSLEGKR